MRPIPGSAPGMPDAAEIALYQKYLEAIDHRGPGADSATAKIQRLLSDILVENLWVLKVRRIRTRFKELLPGLANPETIRVLIRHLVGFDAKKRGTPIAKGVDRLFRLVTPDQDRQ